MALNYLLGPAGYLANKSAGNPLGGAGSSIASTLGGPLMPGSSVGQGIKEFAVGRNPGAEQLRRFDPWQEEIMRMLGQQGLQNANFGDIEQRELSRFNTQTIPGIAERFQGMPGSNRNSSGLQSALGSAGANLGERLAALRSQFGMQQLGQGLQPQFENMYQPGSTGAVQAILPYLVKALGASYGLGI